MQEITREELLNEVQKMRSEGARFMTMTCVDGLDHFELIYSFDRKMEVINYRMKTGKDQSPPSICGVYPCAFLVENEIQDQFGLRFEGLEPNFDGLLILSHDAPRAPMLRKTREDERGKNEDAV